MPLASGTKLGPYEIAAPLGAGGMGEVYRARDTRLGRDVAVKILPAELSKNEVRKQRFEREAKTISSLNHPHICTLHDVGSQDGVDYLVMECLEGETLAKRLEKGPLPLEQVLKYGAQIADALDKAHRAGIVHRDLKPGNIMLTPTGAKLLDFGLAKPATTMASGMTLTAAAAAKSSPVTQEGTIVGTFQYMSPEQVEGKELDGRSDIFSLGAVLYEMVTGHRAFQGKSHLSVASAILEKEPAPISSVKPLTPATLGHAIGRCLAKDPEERWQTAHDLALELKWVGESGSQATAPEGTRKHGTPVVWGVGGLLLGAALIAGAAALFRAKPAAAPVIRFSVAAPTGQSILVESPPQFALSPDGKKLAFRTEDSAGKYELHLRSMNSDEAKTLPGAGGFEESMNPFFSPDGEWLGFFSYNATKLEKLALSGGPPQPLSEITDFAIANWPEPGSIVVAVPGQGLFRVPSAGGKLQPIEAPGGTLELERSAPELLPRGKAILLAVKAGSENQNDIVVLDLSTHERHTILQQGSNPHYLEPGYLVFGREKSIWAAPFDAEHLKLTGEPAPVVDGVLKVEHQGLEQFTVSKNGTLAYLAGTFTEAQRQVVVVDEKGVAKAITQDARAFEDLSVSPDGSRVAMTIEGATWNIWVYDIARKTLGRLTFENDNRDPYWTPDGKRVAYFSQRKGINGLYWRSADGSGPEEQLLSNKDLINLCSWAPDGMSLAYAQSDLKTRKAGIWILPLGGERKPYLYLQTAFDSGFEAFSPDGHWMAYQSDESGRLEIYVQPFPGPGGKWQISTEGGERPEWSRDGKELFYRAGKQLMAARVETKPAFSAGAPELLFTGDYLYSGHYYDVMPDGKHFVFIQTAQQSDRPTKINVVMNWREEMERQLSRNKTQ